MIGKSDKNYSTNKHEKKKPIPNRAVLMTRKDKPHIGRILIVSSSTGFPINKTAILAMGAIIQEKLITSGLGLSLSRIIKNVE